MITFTLYRNGITFVLEYTNVISASFVNRYASIVYNDNGTIRTVVHKLADNEHYTLVSSEIQ